MANMKIEKYENASDSFTFPYNPNSVEFITSKFMDQRPLPYSFTFMGFSSPIKSSISIGLNGHFDGSSKNSNYRSLTLQVNSPELVKLYFENDGSKFYLCTGTTIQKVPTGTRPLHVDYVAKFFSPFGLLFDNTQKSGLKASSVENEGDIVTPIEKITGTVVSGQTVTIQDASGNGFSFVASASGTMTYNIIKVTSEDGATYLTEYGYVTVGTARQTIKNASTSGDIFLKLEPGESLNDIFSAGTVTNITPTFYFRDGWASD